MIRRSVSTGSSSVERFNWSAAARRNRARIIRSDGRKYLGCAAVWCGTNCFGWLILPVASNRTVNGRTISEGAPRAAGVVDST